MATVTITYHGKCDEAVLQRTHGALLVSDNNSSGPDEERQQAEADADTLNQVDPAIAFVHGATKESNGLGRDADRCHSAVG